MRPPDILGVMNIRVEISSLATQHQSGVASYTRLLAEALAEKTDNSVRGHYFNFLKRQQQPQLDSSRIIREENPLFPLRVYAKLQSFNIAPPFDLFLPKVGLTIFPNFATWPTSRSRLSATVIHDLTYLYYPELVEEANLTHLRRVVPRSIKQADIIMTVSESVKAELIKEFKIAPEKCIVTPIPPSDIFKQKINEDERNAVREKYAIGSKNYIFFIGNFEPRKNLATLIKAYTQLPRSVQDKYQLVLAGGKGWKSEGTQKVLDDAIATGADIKHVGYVDDTDRPALYQSASLFVMPSLYEGFGIPILEAMLSNCPVVAADIPVLRETGGEAVIYTDPLDVKTFTETLEDTLTQQSTTTDSMTQKNIERFTWDKNIKTIVEKVDKLLDHHT